MEFRWEVLREWGSVVYWWLVGYAHWVLEGEGIEMYLGEAKINKGDLRSGVEYYAKQGNAIVMRFVYKYGMDLPVQADFYDVRKTWKSVRSPINKRSRDMMLVDDDVVCAEWTDEHGDKQREIASVRVFRRLGVDVYDSEKVKVFDVEWEQEWAWENPRIRAPKMPTEAQKKRRQEVMDKFRF